jgi:hypothetical protein
MLARLAILWYLDVINVQEDSMAMATITIRDVPEELRKAFKLLCVEQDTSMNKRIIELIRSEVERAKGKQ